MVVIRHNTTGTVLFNTRETDLMPGNQLPATMWKLGKNGPDACFVGYPVFLATVNRISVQITDK